MLEIRVDQETAKKFPLGEKVSLDIKGIGVCVFEVKMQQLAPDIRFGLPPMVRVQLRCIRNPVDPGYSWANPVGGQ